MPYSDLRKENRTPTPALKLIGWAEMAISEVVGCGLDDWDSIPGMGRAFFLAVQTDLVVHPASFLITEHGSCFPGDKATRV
jgi:hypothetical protein